MRRGGSFVHELGTAVVELCGRKTGLKEQIGSVDGVDEVGRAVERERPGSNGVGRVASRVEV